MPIRRALPKDSIKKGVIGASGTVHFAGECLAQGRNVRRRFNARMADTLSGHDQIASGSRPDPPSARSVAAIAGGGLRRLPSLLGIGPGLSGAFRPLSFLGSTGAVGLALGCG